MVGAIGGNNNLSWHPENRALCKYHRKRSSGQPASADQPRIQGPVCLPGDRRSTLARIPGRQPRPLKAASNPRSSLPRMNRLASILPVGPHESLRAGSWHTIPSDQNRNSSYISAPGHHLINPHPPLPLHSTVSGLVPNKLCEIVTSLCKWISYLLKASFERRVLIHNFDSHFATQSDDWGPDPITNR
jgi:hypothetical protein